MFFCFQFVQLEYVIVCVSAPRYYSEIRCRIHYITHTPHTYISINSIYILILLTTKKHFLLRVMLLLLFCFVRIAFSYINMCIWIESEHREDGKGINIHVFFVCIRCLRFKFSCDLWMVTDENLIRFAHNLFCEFTNCNSLRYIYSIYQSSINFVQIE